VLKLFVKKEIKMSNQNTSNQTVDTAIANTAIHDCDDSTYEVHVSAATQHMLAQLRENFITGLNIYSLIETTMLKYAESHATKDYLLVKSSQAYKQLSESTNKELVELRQLVEVLKKENEELRNELDGYRNKATVVKEPVTEDDVENAPILVSAPDIEHSSENTVTLSDEDIRGIRGNGIVEIGNSVVKAIPTIRHSADEVKPNDVLSSHAHPHPNGAGNGVFVSTGKPDSGDLDKQWDDWVNKEKYTSRPVVTSTMAFSSEPPTGIGNPDNGAEKIRVTEYSKVANTRI
jgi:hypothetical protein